MTSIEQNVATICRFIGFNFEYWHIYTIFASTILMATTKISKIATLGITSNMKYYL